MLTKTQKNFRKQMKQYKNREPGSEDEFFSYIENNMINGYYSISTKRPCKKSTPAVVILLIIIAIGLKIYNFKAAHYWSTSPVVTQMIGSVKSGGDGDMYMKRVHNLLQEINVINTKQNIRYTIIY